MSQESRMARMSALFQIIHVHFFVLCYSDSYCFADILLSLSSDVFLKLPITAGQPTSIIPVVIVPCHQSL